MRRPVDECPVSSVFAATAGRPRPHGGVDYAAPPGAIAQATFAGYAQASWTKWGGNGVILYGVYENSPMTRLYFLAEYHHLRRRLGEYPRDVLAGEDIAETGNTGWEVWGNGHLHYVQRQIVEGRWQLTDPGLWLPDTPRGLHPYLTPDTRQPLY